MFNNDNLFVEGKTYNVTLKDKTRKELMGAKYPRSASMLRDFMDETDKARIMNTIRNEADWKQVTSSDWYAHLRICGRPMQSYYQKDNFTAEQLFLLYRYDMSHGISMSGNIPIEYNKDANLWVFYSCPKIVGDKERYLYIQAPNKPGAIRVVCKTINDQKGLVLKPYERNTAGYKYIMKYEYQLQEITTQHYDKFKAFLNENVLLSHFANAWDRKDTNPRWSMYDCPYGLLYNKT